MTLTFALAGAAISIGAVHSLAPDHWVPFAAVARAERWSASRTAFVTGACGLGHVTVSVALGLLALFFGFELLEAFGRRLESVSGLFLIGFGVAYGLWGLRRRLTDRAHVHFLSRGAPPPRLTPSRGGARAYLEQDVTEGVQPPVHRHSHPPSAIRHESVHRPMTAWALFLLFSADPCVAVIPLIFAAAPLGWVSTLAVVSAYELATVGTMVALVLPARAAVTSVGGAWADRWGDVLAGGVVATVGFGVMMLGV